MARSLKAILALDMVGYSRLMAADEEGTHARLKAHREELLEPAIAKYQGHIIKTTGDGLLAEFPSAVDCVACSVEIQRRIARRNQDVVPDRRIQFRVGISVGDIIKDGGDVYGTGVNTASRLEGIAEPGGILLSDDAYRQIHGKLEIELRDRGPQHLKNIDEPVPTRDFLFVGDCADGLIYLLAAYSDEAPINLGTGREVSIRELAQTISEVVGYRGDLAFDTTKPDGMPRKILDVSQVNQSGWSATTPLADGLRAT